MTRLVSVEVPAPPMIPIERLDALTYTPVEYVVQDLVTGLTVLAGPPNSGKSAAMIDMALAVSAGRPWLGREVKQGPVLYIAAEAAASTFSRAKACESTKYAGANLPAYFSAFVPQLGNDFQSAEDTERVIQTVRHISREEHTPVRLVVIDTVSSVLAGSDENGTGMVLLAAAATKIALVTGAAVVLIHHPGKRDDQNLRGHSSLAGAADVVAITSFDARSNIHSITVRKFRDGAIGKQLLFRTVPADLEVTDAYGTPVSTILVEPADGVAAQGRRITGKNQTTALKAIRSWIEARGHQTGLIAESDLKSLLDAAGVASNRRPEALRGLERAGVLSREVGGYAIDVSKI